MQRPFLLRYAGNAFGSAVAALTVVVLGLSVSLAPWVTTSARAAAVTTTDANGLVFAAEDADVAAGATVSGYVGTATSVSIPTHVDIEGTTYEVSAIGPNALSGFRLTSLSFQAPSNVSVIGEHAFQYNDFSTLTIPSSVVSIGDWAFFDSDVKSLAFEKPSSLVTLGEYAFYSNEFLTIEVPATLTTVGTHAFAQGYIERVTFEAPSSLTTIGSSMFANNPLDELVLSDSVTSIGTAAFSMTGLESIDLPSSLISIRNSAFSGSYATEVHIPTSVTSIGDRAFDQSSRLDRVVFSGDRPFSVGSIRPFGIAGSATIYFPCGARGFAFPIWRETYETSTTCDVSFDGGGGAGSMDVAQVTSGERLPLATFTRADSSFIGWRTSPDGAGPLISDNAASAFISSTQLYAQWAPATPRECFTVEVREGSAVIVDLDLTCSAADIVLPTAVEVEGVSYRVTRIGAGAFEGRDITSVSIPNTVSSIDERAFFGTDLSEVVIPASVQSIGDQAFDANPSLDRVTFHGAAPISMSAATDARPLGPGATVVYYRSSAPGFSHPSWRGYNTKAEHVLSFNANLGSGTMFPMSLTTGDQLPVTSFTRYDFRFAGWNSAPDGSGVAVAPGGTSPFAVDTILYAQWVPDTEPPVLSSPGVIFSSTLKTCATDETIAVIPISTPMLSIVATDPERSNLKTIFTLANADGTVLWVSGESISSSGNRVSAEVPNRTIPGSGIYRWRAQTFDSRMVGSEYSPWCEFQVDITSPPAPMISTIAEGAAAVYESETIAGGVGRTGLFRLLRGEGSDAVRFTYGFNQDTGGTSVVVGPDGSATISYTPTRTGPVVLYVRAYDEAGNFSSRVDYRFTVGVLQTVSFLSNGGTGVMPAISESTPKALPVSTLVRPGYRFTGWNTAANGTGQSVADGAVWDFSSGASLYAQWQQNEIATISIEGPVSVVTPTTEDYTVEGFDDFGVSLGDVTNRVTISGSGLSIAGSSVTFTADPSAAPGSVVSRTLRATFIAIPTITDELAIEVRAPQRNLNLLPERIGGADRYATGAAIAGVWDAYFDADVVFVATGENYPDALAGAAAAAYLNAPLILTPRTSVPVSVMSRLNALQPNRIVVLGASGAVSESVVATLRTVTSSPTVSRIAGADRYATAREIIKYAYSVDGNGDTAEGGSIDTLVVATGRNFPDALSAAPAVASVGGAVMLVDGSAASVPAATMRLIRDLGPQNIVIAGATGAVSAAIEAQLKAAFGSGLVVRIAGADRFTTSAAISDHFFDSSDAVFFAVGSNFPDALAGAVLAGELKAPLIVTPRACVSTATKGVVDQLAPARTVLLGSTAVITNNVALLGLC